MDTVRTRFAPSPTGYMHIGNLRTALYEYLLARNAGGKFILRIEDTDQERFVEGSMDVIYKTLELTGISYDEGPGKGGEYGPYIQSERKDIYKKYAIELVEKGAAYYCFCTKERLDSLKLNEDTLGTSFNYDRHCLTLSKQEILDNLKNNIPYVIRQKMPREGTTTFSDAVYGDISVENITLEDQVLLKSDGMPTYNFANVVDDHLMKITHVVRGNEYLSSTPKYNLLYKAFGWDVPVYIHVSQIMKDATNKLSKRNGDASFQDLLVKGYLSEAVLNYIALLGWSPGGTEEFYTLAELEKAFSIEGISKSPALFDVAKLNWMNSEYIRKMSQDEFYKISEPWLRQVITNPSINLAKVSALIQQRTEVLNEIPGKISFFQELQSYSTALYTHKKMKTNPENSLINLEKIYIFIDNYTGNWTSDQLYSALCEFSSSIEVKNSQVLWPIRTALSGLDVSPGGATELMEIFGKEETLTRINIGIDLLSVGGNI